MKNKKVVLIIRDGWGHSKNEYGNAIMAAKTPNHDKYVKEFPTAILKCMGNDVGNPKGVMGGSEVGHLTLGAGRVVWQPQELINRAIEDRSFFENKSLLAVVENCKKNDSALHLMGLFSDAGVHSDLDHLLALMELAKMNGLSQVFLHLVLDGRDVPERSALTILERLEKELKRMKVGKVVSVIGRFYAMDRDLNWKRTEKAFDMLVHGQGYETDTAEKAVKMAYERGAKTDYYVEPTIVKNSKGMATLIKKEDSFVWFNFRSDRSRQLVAMLKRLPMCPTRFQEGSGPFLVCMCRYDESWNLPIAFGAEEIENGLGEYLSKKGKSQLRVAETEKYAHVTFFFNGQREKEYEGEDRIMVNSPEVKSYDLKPEMSARKVCNKVLEELGKYDFILVNFANTDLAGHSGVFSATVKACEVVDKCVGEIVNMAIENDYYVLLGADHGNAEHMLYENGEIDASHGFNPITYTLIGKKEDVTGMSLKNGGLSNVAATVLKLMGIEKAEEMNEGLIEEKA